MHFLRRSLLLRITLTINQNQCLPSAILQTSTASKSTFPLRSMLFGRCNFNRKNKRKRTPVIEFHRASLFLFQRSQFRHPAFNTSGSTQHQLPHRHRNSSAIVSNFPVWPHQKLSNINLKMWFCLQNKTAHQIQEWSLSYL